MPAAKKFKMRKMRGGGYEQLGGAGSSGGGTGILHTILLIVLIGVLVFIGYHIWKLTTKSEKPNPVYVNMNGGDGGGDDRYAQAPRPMRTWRAPPDTTVWNPTALPSIATRGLPETFQTVGLVSYPGGDVKPLYGRRTAGSNDRWNYYTRTDTYNPVPIPLSQGRRDCMEDVGCNEVFDGDTLKSMNGEQVKVKIYKMNGPTYIA
jgi:hypothetical protein